MTRRQVQVSGRRSRRRGRPAGAARVTTVAAAATGLLFALAGLVGCSSSKDTTSGTNFVTDDGTITMISSAKRSQPIALAGTTVEGTELNIASYRGKTVVLNVWGSWCGPCRKEAPGLQTAYTRLRDSGVEFLGINVRDQDQAQAAAFQKSFGVTYPSVVDEDGSLLLALRGAVAAKAIPTTLVLDGQGRIAARISGPTTTTTLVDLVQDVQNGRVAPSAAASGSPS
jgi:thiol-disulfide isomerase/thioredoxin